jgi:hypothetical protein
MIDRSAGADLSGSSLIWWLPGRLNRFARMAGRLTATGDRQHTELAGLKL